MADFTPWWKPAIAALNIAVGILALGSLGMYVYTRIAAKKEEN